MKPEDYLDKIIEAHKDRYSKDDSELIPFAVFVKDDLPYAVAQLIATPGGDWRETVPTLKDLPVFDDADGYIISSEAWLASYPRETEDFSDIEMPSQRPDRIEVIINVIFMKKGEKAMKNLQIIRGEAGQVVELKEMKIATDVFESRFDLYDQKTIH